MFYCQKNGSTTIGDNPGALCVDVIRCQPHTGNASTTDKTSNFVRNDRPFDFRIKLF